MKLWKYSGILLVATGILHLLVAIVSGWNTYREMFSECFVNCIGNDFQRAYAFWFFTIGILLMLLGSTLQYYIRKEQKPAPVFLGYALLVFSVAGCMMLPLSGFWLFIPQALILILAKRKL
jgi:predicted ferric reductase